MRKKNKDLLHEVRQEEELSRKTLTTPTKNVTKEKRVFVKPELYDQLVQSVVTSVPQKFTVGQVNELLDKLQKTSILGDVTIEPVKS